MCFVFIFLGWGGFGLTKFFRFDSGRCKIHKYTFLIDSSAFCADVGVHELV